MSDEPPKWESYLATGKRHWQESHGSDSEYSLNAMGNTASRTGSPFPPGPGSRLVAPSLPPSLRGSACWARGPFACAWAGRPLPERAGQNNWRSEKTAFRTETEAEGEDIPARSKAKSKPERRCLGRRVGAEGGMGWGGMGSTLLKARDTGQCAARERPRRRPDPRYALAARGGDCSTWAPGTAGRIRFSCWAKRA